MKSLSASYRACSSKVFPRPALTTIPALRLGRAGQLAGVFRYLPTLRSRTSGAPHRVSQRAGRGRFVLPRSGCNPRACDRTGAQQLKGELEIHNRAQGELFASARDLETSLGQAREQHVAGRQAAESEARETRTGHQFNHGQSWKFLDMFNLEKSDGGN